VLSLVLLLLSAKSSSSSSSSSTAPSCRGLRRPSRMDRCRNPWGTVRKPPPLPSRRLQSRRRKEPRRRCHPWKECSRQLQGCQMVHFQNQKSRFG
jgi:hypothetical protein